MAFMRQWGGLTVLAMAACLLLAAAPARGETVLVMGTGQPGGNYNAFGRLFAKVINQASARTGIRVKSVISDGSVSNIRALAAGKYQLALAQADMEYMAWNGKGPWAKAGKQMRIRTVYKIYTEAVTCVAREGIATCADLKGKRVALGSEGSGTYTNALQALSTCWLKPTDLAEALKINPLQAMRLLYNGKIDAFFYTIGHPNLTMRKFLATYRKGQLVDLPPSKGMINKVPYYVRYFIWTSDYPGLRNQGSKVTTFGIRSYILSSDKVPAKVIYEVARLYLANLGRFKKELPFMQDVEPPSKQSREDLTWNLSAPYHDGVKRLGKEMGFF